MEGILQRTEMEMREMLRRTLKPEFLNRIDETIVFKPLSKSDVREIVKIHLGILSKRLVTQDIRLKPTEEVIDYLAEEGYDPQFGARPVKRLIQKNVLNALSKQLLAGTVERGVDLILDIFDGQFVFRKPIKEEELI